ncbi:MAG: DNA recombination protein RmuC [Candidatus Krumholzibacteria bacterium]|jgi:DNA recombination protein RmuC|nr:DNA recombination protein RmuC [Candidatus Krumholzibacteria bacterium]MDP6668362.1 DNA recombination protein RmuC [Candidatus Krumholzibacteria bacterium]MDP6796279.1 DNA recombination protein RmuC [Candidatus Krumholzibacteria bacterium]MDP7022183.1 DNA recombination protein RmuC [Candidatus Krumholzibacteria bacterium]
MTLPIVLALLAAFVLGGLTVMLTSRAKSAKLERDFALAKQELDLLKQDEERLKSTMRSVGEDALKSNREAILQELEKQKIRAEGDLKQREEAVKNLVEPIEKQLKEVDKQIRDIEKERKENQGGLAKQLEEFSRDQDRLRQETKHLVNALSKSSVRGQWGELQLRRVVEMAGMIEYCDFVEQDSVSDIDESRRPDMIIRMPNGQQVVVDAKTPMEAWLQSHDTEDDAERHALLVKHAKSVKDHIRSLSRKNYQKLIDHTPEFVVMFLPSEAVFYAALDQNPALIEEGVDKKIIMATPTTLIALLRSVAYGWQQHTLSENAEEIRRLGKDLYERLDKLNLHFASLGKSLNSSVGHFNKAMGSFDRRVLVSARKFTELGVGSGEISASDLIEVTAVDRQIPENTEESS